MTVKIIGENSLLLSIKRLQNTDTRPLMKDIGQVVEASTVERFDTKKDPENKSWARWSPVTAAMRSGGQSLLTKGGHLKRSITTGKTTATSAEVGTNLIYANTQQFGAKKGAFRNDRFTVPWGDIPARAFVGFSKEDEKEISNLILKTVQAKWG